MKVALDLDGVLGDTRPLWREWLEDAARKYRAIAPLDAAGLPEDRAAAAAALDDWAEAGIGDWQGALERFAEDRAPLYFRRDPAATAALRRLHAQGAELVAFTDAPEPLARVALAQLGADRQLRGLVAGADAERRALESLGEGATTVRVRDELLRLDA